MTASDSDSDRRERKPVFTPGEPTMDPSLPEQESEPTTARMTVSEGDNAHV